jgi:hypothetical protein
MYVRLLVTVKSASFGITVDFTDVTSIHFTPIFKITFPALSGMAALSFFIHNIIITIMRNNRHQENNVSTMRNTTGEQSLTPHSSPATEAVKKFREFYTV